MPEEIGEALRETRRNIGRKRGGRMWGIDVYGDFLGI